MNGIRQKNGGIEMICLDKNNISNIDFSSGTGITFGKFDGIHIGHMELINALKDLCREYGHKSMVYTFLQNPSNVLNNSGIKQIYPLDKKKELLNDTGIDYLILNDFDQYYANNTPEQFVKLLVNKYNVKVIVVGYNTRFGACKAGGVHELEHLCRKYNILLRIVDKVIYKDKSGVSYDVSSTLIREVLESGDNALAEKLLGREY